MNRALFLILFAAFIPASLAAAPAALRPDEPPPKGVAELQGTWKLASIEAEGKSQDPIGGGVPRWVIKGEKVFYGGDEIIRLTADPATTPRVIDLKFKEPERAYEGIYSVEKSTLKVCLNTRDGAKDRPGKLETKEQDGFRLLVFEREKAAPAEATEGLTGFVGIALSLDEESKAVTVDSPIKGSPAEKAGLKKGDIILKVGATAATDLETTVKSVRQAKPGAKLDIQIKRGEKESVVAVKVGVLPFHYVAGLE